MAQSMSVEFHHTPPFGHLVRCGYKQTQLDSWEQTKRRLAEKQDAVLEAVRKLGAASPADIADLLGWDIYKVRPRCTELEQMGHLIDTKKPRVWTRTGKRQTVYILARILEDNTK